MAGSAEHEVGPRQPHGGRPAHVTTIRKAIIIGVLVALLVGGASSLATARLTDRQSDIDELAGQVGEQEAQIAQLASQADEGEAEVDRLNKEITGLKQHVFDLEADKLSLEQQLSQYVNPAQGPTPTAALTVSWVQPDCGYSQDDSGVKTYTDCGQTVVCVTIENTSESALDIYFAYSQFTAVDGDSFVYPPSLATVGYGITLPTPLMDGRLGQGEKRRGELLFVLPRSTFPTALPLPPVVLTSLVWNIGFGETPQIVVDLPAPQGSYAGGGTNPSQC